MLLCECGIIFTPRTYYYLLSRGLSLSFYLYIIYSVTYHFMARVEHVYFCGVSSFYPLVSGLDSIQPDLTSFCNYGWRKSEGLCVDDGNTKLSSWQSLRYHYQHGRDFWSAIGTATWVCSEVQSSRMRWWQTSRGWRDQ